jgi:ABC-type transporter Mla MlaB component
MKRLCLVLVLLAGAARADTVELKDGTKIEGDIIGETDTNFTIEVAQARGTILNSQTIAKSDIAGVTRVSEEDRDYRESLKSTLNADVNYTVARYDQVIEGVFRKFLAQYPASVHAGDVTSRLAQWQEERDKTAAGLIKINGAWLSAEQLDRFGSQARAIQYAKQGAALVNLRQWQAAAERFEAVLELAPRSGSGTLARRELPEVYRQWRAALTQRQQKLQTDLQALDRRQPPVPALTRPLHTELALIKRTLDGLDGRAEKAGVNMTTASPTQLVNAAQSPVDASKVGDNPELLRDIGNWVREYWLYMAGAAAIVVLLFSRTYLK